MIVTLRFWNIRHTPITVVLRVEVRPLIDERGVTVEGDITDGGGVFAPGHAVLFVPLRQLLWWLVRDRAPET